MTENELLLNKIKELENIVDDIQLLKTEMQRLRDKNSSDWNYWRKQQSDLHAQLKQQQSSKEKILNQFDRLQKQVNLNEPVNFIPPRGRVYFCLNDKRRTLVLLSALRT